MPFISRLAITSGATSLAAMLVALTDISANRVVGTGV